jgi:hypothetical protein
MHRDTEQTTASEGHQSIMSLESVETKSHELGAEAKRTSQCGTTPRSTSSSGSQHLCQPQSSSSSNLSQRYSALRGMVLVVVVVVVVAVAQQRRELVSGGPLRAVLPHLLV